MYFKAVLVFSGAVYIYAQRIRELCHSIGCFDSTDTQISVTLDGDEVYHADFKKGVLDWESKIPIIFHVAHAYDYALHYRTTCRSDISRWKPDTYATTKVKEAPEVIVYPKDEVVKDEGNTLICFINHFFPPKINIKWTKNDVEVTVEDPSIRCLANHDGTFYVLSTLDFVPHEGDIYACTVEHEALEEAQTKFWQVDINETTVGAAVFCGLGLSLGLLGPVFSDENFSQVNGCCIFKGPDFNDIEYIITNYFNKKLMMQYNSTRGNWTGFTAHAIELAKGWNGDPFDALTRAFEKVTLCTHNVGIIRQADTYGATVPKIKLNSVKWPSGKHASMLVCSAYNFYPKQIQVTWLRDGHKVTSGVSFTDSMSDGDWLYQIHSYLEYTPTPRETITCMVEHFSLSEPLLQVWDSSLPASERNEIAVGVCGLMLGFVFTTSGFIYYKKKLAAYTTSRQERVLVPVVDLPAAGAT